MLEEILNKYFGHLTFTCIDQKGNYMLYAAGLSGFSDGTRRYVFIFILPQYSEGLHHKTKLWGLMNWENIQTRTIKNGYPLKEQAWRQPRIDKFIELPLQIISRSNRQTNYNIPYPEYDNLEIELLHNPKKKSKYQYPDHYTLSGALDTFYCNITRINITPLDNSTYMNPPQLHNPSTINPPPYQPEQFAPPLNNSTMNNDYEIIE